MGKIAKQTLHKVNKIPSKVYAASVLGIAGLLQFYKLDKWSIWHDESFTAMLLSYDMPEILVRTAKDVHPPLYYILLFIWTKMFGTSMIAMRSMSIVFTLAAFLMAYLLIKKLFNEKAARLSLAVLAVAPFILRYAQEARMYALVSFLLLAATYLLVRLVDSRDKINKKWWIVYALAIAGGLYSHYYSLFLLPVHWLYVAMVYYKKRRPKELLAVYLKRWLYGINKRWWQANIGILILFLPWLPVAIRQFTSIQGAFWIPPVDHATFFSTLTNFLIYQDAERLKSWFSLFMLVAIIGLIVVVIKAVKQNVTKRRQLGLLITYASVPPLLIFFLSLPPFQPVYNNRYFSLTAVAFYCLLAILITLKPLNVNKKIQLFSVLLLLAALVIGVRNVYTYGNFNPDREESYSMKGLIKVINQNYTYGDAVVSTSLSTYFDVRYYNDTHTLVRLYAPEAMSGNGNTSLVYDREDILLADYNLLSSLTRTVWLVTDSVDKQPNVPSNWAAVGERHESGYAAVQKYFIAR